jgi:surface antigen
MHLPQPETFKQFFHAPLVKFLAGFLVFCGFYLLTLRDIPKPALLSREPHDQAKVLQAWGIEPASLSSVEALQPVSFAVMGELSYASPPRPTTANTYEINQCTWWVKQWKPNVPNTWGDAKEWESRARQDGWTVSNTPVVGAVAQTSKGRWGHVALVIGVDGDSVTIREGNYDYNGSVRTASVPVSKYIYIH